jgi:hypothetical protein
VLGLAIRPDTERHRACIGLGRVGPGQIGIGPGGPFGHLYLPELYFVVTRVFLLYHFPVTNAHMRLLILAYPGTHVIQLVGMTPLPDFCKNFDWS